MSLYQLVAGGALVKRLEAAGMAFIPADPQNADYQEYLRWVAAGNTTDPADPPVLTYGQVQPIAERRVRTTNATPVDIYRATVPPNTAYKARFTVWGITDDLVNFRMIEAIIVVGRSANGVGIIQTRVSPANATIVADHAIGTGGTWNLPAVVVNNAGAAREVLVRITGPAAPAVNWLLTGAFETFSPGGV